MSRTRRVHHPRRSELSDGASIELSATEAHHLRKVLRAREGEPVAVFDGEGGEWEGRVTSCTCAGVHVALGRRYATVAEPPIAVVLHQGLGRYDRVEWVIQKATELGVAAIRVFAGERTETKPPSTNRLERWNRLTLEACKQSGRARIPPVEYVDRLGSPDEEEPGWILSPAEQTPPLGQGATSSRPPRLHVAVGPEGGFSAGELEQATGAGWTAASLGPRTLRTETAGIVAVTLALHLWGDLAAPSRPGD